MLSHAYWQSEFGGDPDVLGRTLIVNSVPLTIVGVAPRGFHGTAVSARASVFVPITFRGVVRRLSIPNHDNRGFYWVHLSRASSRASARDGAAAINPLYRAILSEVEAPLLTGGDSSSSRRFVRDRSCSSPARAGKPLLVPLAGGKLELLLAVSGAVLLLCCANVAGLMLLRALGAHRRDGAARVAGATRGRLASLLLAESLLLALPAALLSLPVALLTLRGASGIPGASAAAFDVELSAARGGRRDRRRGGLGARRSGSSPSGA